MAFFWNRRAEKCAKEKQKCIRELSFCRIVPFPGDPSNHYEQARSPREQYEEYNREAMEARWLIKTQDGGADTACKKGSDKKRAKEKKRRLILLPHRTLVPIPVDPNDNSAQARCTRKFYEEYNREILEARRLTNTEGKRKGDVEPYQAVFREYPDDGPPAYTP